MSKQDIQEMVQGFKRKQSSTYKQRVTLELRDILELSRPDFLKLSLHQACELLIGLIEDEAVRELKGRGEYIALRDIIVPMPRKERSDKGVPRGKRTESEPEGELEANYNFDEETAA